MSKSNKMWGGRFTDHPDKIMEAINASVSYDKRLWKYDIMGSKAHGRMLFEQGIISKQDFDLIIGGLDQITQEIENGEFEFIPSLEDIHMNIEHRLSEIIGDAAGRLHTARSRNDQVAVDTKLYLRDILDKVILTLKDIQNVILDKADIYHNTIMPGFTHLQTAQPVTFGHHLLAYYEMFERDRQRLGDARKRLNQGCPLGSAALAGTVYKTDRFMIAKELGFDKPTRNSLDSVSDRDFALEFMANAAICAGHISRFCEEIILWMTPQFNFVSLSDKWTTGSSIMPQKKNPDAAELLRAKTGRINGNLLSFLTVMKGLPLAYSKDMQEDKEALFDTVDHFDLSLEVFLGVLKDLKANKISMREAAEKGFSTATDIADWLVKYLQIPFRKAHHITGEVVKYAEDNKCNLSDVPIEELKKIEPMISEEIYDFISVDASVCARTSYGGTSPENVKMQIDQLRDSYVPVLR